MRSIIFKRIKNKFFKKLPPIFLAAVLVYQLFWQSFFPWLVWAQEIKPSSSPALQTENNQSSGENNSPNEAGGDQTPNLENQNVSEVENKVEVQAESGNNTISSSPSHSASPLAAEDQVSAVSTSVTPAELDVQGESTGSGNLNKTELDKNLCATESGLLAENCPMDEFSQNQATISGEEKIINLNHAEVTNEVDSTANSGNNQISGGNTQVVTGEALVTANLVNFVNTNIIGKDFWQAIVNIFATQENDLDLTQIQGYENFEPALISVLATNQYTTDGLVNLALANFLSQFRIYNQNNAIVVNNLELLANSGGNSLVGDQGRITTGEASAQANVFNLVNTNLIGSDWFFGIINIFGQLNGDIILPYELDFLMPENLSVNSNLPPTLTQASGDNFENTATAAAVKEVNLNNYNQAQLINNLEVMANSGNNTATGSGTIQTGNATALASLLNIINTNIFDSHWLLLVLHHPGDWQGKIVGWWGYSLNMGEYSLVWVKLPSLGEDVLGVANENKAAASQVEIVNENEAKVINNLKVTADSGFNQSQGEEVVMQTGNATALAKVVNVVNTNIFGNHWFFCMINVLGNWFGDLIFPRPDLSVRIISEKSTIFPGEEISYLITYQNEGRLAAKQTRVIDTLPAGMSFLSASQGGTYKEGKVVWALETLPSGRGGTLSLTLKAESNLSSGEELTNSVLITSVTDEPQKENNNSLATVLVALPASLVNTSTYNDFTNEISESVTSENKQISESPDLFTETNSGLFASADNFESLTEPLVVNPSLPNLSEKSTRGVAGVSCSWAKTNWWFPLSIQALFTLSYFLLTRNRKFRWWWFVPLLAAAVSQLVHQMLGCECTFNSWCRHYWLFNLGILTGTSLYYYLPSFLIFAKV